MSRFGKETENPNTRKVSNILRTMLVEKGETSRAMVFVKTRETCKRLAEFLDEDLKAIDAKAAPLYGKENRREEEGEFFLYKSSGKVTTRRTKVVILMLFHLRKENHFFDIHRSFNDMDSVQRYSEDQ